MKRKNLFRLALVCYGALMLWLLFIRARGVVVTDYWEQMALRLNLIPFSSIGSMLRTLWEYPRPDVLWVVIYNLGGNIIMFVPLGFLLPTNWTGMRKLSRTLAAVALIMTCVELTQLLTLRGFCEVDDLMLNLLGAAIGYGIFRLFNRKNER